MKRFIRTAPRVVVIIFRVVMAAVFVGIILFVLLGVVKGCVHSPESPTIIEAPWAIQTSSRYYYAREFSLQDGMVPTIKDYWTFDGKRYHFQEGTKSFPEAIYGKVAIIRRTK